eukprot:scaffold6986_cov142-Skeletonema_menzelii.AAC.2
MEWIKQKLGLTPLSQQSHDASSSLPKNDRNNDDDVDMNHEEQSSEGGMELSFEMMETNHNNDSDDDDDGGGSGDDQDGQQLQYYLTQPRYNEEEDDDDSSVVKESSSVDIECNDMQAQNDYNDSDDDSNEGSIPTQQRQEKKSKQPQGTIATKRGGRGGRAKRQMGDMLSQLPSTPTTTIQSSSSLSTSVAKKSKSSLAAAATATTAAELVASPQVQPVENTTSTPSIIMGGTTTPPLNSPPRNTTISEQQQVQNKNNGNNTTYTIHTKEEKEPIMTLKSTPQPPPKEHPLLCQLTMKQKAIDRSILHLSDNSYSFVYDELSSTTTTSSKTEAEEVVLSNGVVTSKKGIKGSAVKDLDFISWSPAGVTTKEKVTTTTTTTESNKDESNNDNNGLPFIGPGLKDQYNTLLKLLRDGLLGTYNDDDTEQDNNNNIDNIIQPKIQSNVSAILMGPRGHGKSLLLERCLAELSRVACKRKERALKKMQRLQQLQQQQQQQLNGGSDDDDDDDGIIQQLSKVNELYTQSSFRVVRINGLLYQGDNAVACTREIARQINSMSRMEKKNRSGSSSGRKGGTPLKESVKRRRTSSNYQDVQMTPTKQYSPTTQPSSPMMSPKSPIHANNNNNESHQFRLRRSGFNTNISLLDEALRTARIDGIPILIVLEELDTFLAGGKSYSMTGGGGTEQLSHQEQGGANDRQLLLYHLLDRVADHKFLVSLVGMTTNLSTINQLEKRVQSRAEGTSKVIYFGHDVNGGYDACVESLLGKFYTPPMLLSNKMMDDESGGMQLLDNDSRDECMEHTEMMNLRNEVEAIFRGKQAGSDEEPDCDQEINDFSLIQRALKRNYELHMDIRWFCGVLDVALSLLMSDIDELKLRCSNGTMDDDVQIPKLTPKHIAHALIIMGASLDDIASNVGRPGIPNQNALEQIRWGQLIGDPNHYSALVGTNPRLVALLDLSGPQIAVLMAARRIMARDNARSTVDDEAAANGNKSKNGSKNVSVLSLVAPLTYKRIEDEYTTSFVNSERYTISSDRYPPHVLYRSFMDLMELDLIRLKKEHCEGGALQYEYLNSLSTGANISNAPLYVNLEWELDFIGVLKAGLLKCSTSLREWGLKIMN